MAPNSKRDEARWRATDLGQLTERHRSLVLTAMRLLVMRSVYRVQGSLLAEA